MMSYVSLTSVYPKHMFFHEAHEQEEKTHKILNLMSWMSLLFFPSLGVKDIYFLSITTKTRI